MNEKQIIHRKKVKLMGTILIVVSIISAVFMISCLAYTGISYRSLGGAVAFDGVLEINLPGNIEDLERRLAEQSKDPASDEVAQILEQARKDLQEAKTLLADPELKEIRDELPTGELNLKRIFFALIYSTVLTILMAGFLVLIGRSWRAMDPFSRHVVVGLRGLGIIFLVQLVLTMLVPEPEASEVFDVLNAYPFYGLTMVPLLAISLLLLTLSWVIEHGRQLDENEQLTI